MTRMRSNVALWMVGLILAPSIARAGFSIEGSPTVSSDHTSIGRFTPYEERGMASFAKPTGEQKPQQERYANAELMVDMAYRAMTQTGSGETSRLDAYADGVPFNEAMTLIIPSGWQLYRDKALSSGDIPELLTFQGGKPWPEVLGSIGEREGLHFHVDWYQHTVMMSQGRRTTPNYKRIRVIAEPPKVQPAVAAAPVAAPAAAIASAAIPAAATTTAIAPAPALTTTSALPASAAPIVTSKPAAQAVIKPATPPAEVAKPIPAPPAETRLSIREGTLRENVIRLSKEQGWKDPEWKIDADYKINSGYILTGKTFAEAMAKLLLLHPIEADVNVAQRKIFVLTEVR